MANGRKPTDSETLAHIRDLVAEEKALREQLQRRDISESEEHIATNLLADRLKRLVQNGLLSRQKDPTHKQKGIYSLTKPAIELVPLLAQLGSWGRRHTPASRELSIRAQLLEAGGPPMWEAFMTELRSLHLGQPAPARSVLKELQAAFESTRKRRNQA